jgi:ABC-type amino acid transport substrate-binding protein
MMTAMRTLAFGAALAAMLTACSSPSPEERIQAAELARLTPLKKVYPGVVMGFDFKGDTTLVVSLDIQNYIGLDYDVVNAMNKSLLLHWRAAWTATHPARHAILQIRAIDFIGRTIWHASTRV